MDPEEHREGRQPHTVSEGREGGKAGGEEEGRRVEVMREDVKQGNKERGEGKEVKVYRVADNWRIQRKMESDILEIHYQ